MADYVAAHITIGGPVRKRLVPKLCDAICRQGVSLAWGEFDFCPESGKDLLKACCQIAGAKVLRLYGDEVAYGNFDLLQEFLLDRKLPFDRWHESKYEIPCELTVYRPGSDLRFFLTNLEGEVAVKAEPLLELADLLQEAEQHLQSDSTHRAQKILRRCQRLASQHLPSAIPPLPALTIVAG
jgi:hypothetical protein